MGSIKAYTSFSNTLHQTAPSVLENALKLNFKALYETENLDPLQGPTPHSDPIINTHTKQAQKLRMDLPPALLTCRLQPKTHCHPQKQRFGYPRLSKKIPSTPPKTDSSHKGTLQKVNLPPAKLGMLFHVHLSVTEFWPHIYSLSPAQSSYQTSQIRPNTKMGVQTNLQSTARPHQSADLKLERAASRIKERSPPCLFRLPPWENVNR